MEEALIETLSSSEAVESAVEAVEEVSQDVVVFDEHLHLLVEQLTEIISRLEELQVYATGVLVFFAVVVLLWFSYKFIRLFF